MVGEGKRAANVPPTRAPNTALTLIAIIGGMNTPTRAPAPPATPDFRQYIRTIPDYPRPGVRFRDVTTLMGNAEGFRLTIDAMAEPWKHARIDHVAGIEARGFILGGALAHQLGAGFVPLRKKGKLPHKTVRVAYSLEYGVDEMEMHTDAIRPAERILLVDDLIATGGTAQAAVKLLRSLGGDILGAGFIIDLPELGGAEKLRDLGVNVQSLVAFDGH